MNREQRLKYAGIFFYLVTVLAISLSPRGSAYVTSLANTGSGIKDMYIPVITAAMLVFTSESAGYIFNSLFVFLWNLQGGLKPEYGATPPNGNIWPMT